MLSKRAPQMKSYKKVHPLLARMYIIMTTAQPAKAIIAYQKRFYREGFKLLSIEFTSQSPAPISV